MTWLGFNFVCAPWTFSAALFVVLRLWLWFMFNVQSLPRHTFNGRYIVCIRSVQSVDGFIILNLMYFSTFVYFGNLLKVPQLYWVMGHLSLLPERWKLVTKIVWKHIYKTTLKLLKKNFWKETNYWGQSCKSCKDFIEDSQFTLNLHKLLMRKVRIRYNSITVKKTVM